MDSSEEESNIIVNEEYKGIYQGKQEEKYTDPATGAHFEYYDLCKRIARVREHRIQK